MKGLTKEIYSTLIITASSAVFEARRDLDACSPGSPNRAFYDAQLRRAIDAHRFITVDLASPVPA